MADAQRGFHPLLDRMIGGERRFQVCDQGRVHTNVTNLPRWCRQFIRLGGSELVSVDISTSQPLILSLVIARERAGVRGSGGTGPSTAHNSPADASMLPPTAVTTSAAPALVPAGKPTAPAGGGPEPTYRPESGDDINEFMRDCLEGRVYDRIVAAVADGRYTRDRVKRRFLAVIYGECRNMHTTVGKAIELLYPTVFRTVAGLNMRLGPGGCRG